MNINQYYYLINSNHLNKLNLKVKKIMLDKYLYIIPPPSGNGNEEWFKTIIGISLLFYSLKDKDYSLSKDE